MVNWQERIESNPDILLGKPVIKGTRLCVEFLLGRLANGWSEHELLENYPKLEAQDLRAVYAYVLSALKDGLMYQPIKMSA